MPSMNSRGDGHGRDLAGLAPGHGVLLCPSARLGEADDVPSAVKAIETIDGRALAADIALGLALPMPHI